MGGEVTFTRKVTIVYEQLNNYLYQKPIATFYDIPPIQVSSSSLRPTKAPLPDMVQGKVQY